MSTVSVKIVPVIVPPPPPEVQLTITMSKQDAADFLCLCHRVGGLPQGSARGLFDQIMAALMKKGIKQNSNAISPNENLTFCDRTVSS